MLVHCACGQEFRVLSQRFPWTVKCHVCGKRFVVYDTGKAVDAEATQASKTELPMSIQSQPILSVPGLPSDAVCDDQHLKAFAVDPRERLSNELQEIDRRWMEYCDATAWRFCGLRLTPTPAKAIAFQISAFIVVFIVPLFFAYQTLGILGVILVLRTLSYLFDISLLEQSNYLHREATAFQEMQAYFQQLRLEAISKEIDGDNSPPR